MSAPGTQRLASLDDGIVRLGPQTVHIDVTNSCNVDCVTCWDHSPHLHTPKPTAWKRTRVEPMAVRALLDDIQSLGGLEAVIVSGMGEPFTHPEIYDILADLKTRGLHVTIITNLLAADPERLIALGIDALLIGVHGASEASYLAFHPSWNPQHWQRLHDSLARLAAAGRRDKHVHVICAPNAHELVAMIEQAARYGAERVNFKLASLRNGTEAVALTEAQRARLLAHDVDAAQARAEVLGVPTNLEVLRRQLALGDLATAPFEETGCFIGYHYSRITVDGSVLYCCNTRVQVGTLAQAPFSALWKGDAWQALRAQLRSGQYFPGCEQCGKWNQNVKLSARFRAVYGEDRWRQAAGHGPAAAPVPLRLKVLP
ncbi:MAG: radical SAM protein [Myxococcales bacterium]|nr:radical SAM protein [Myxococcales bacterium]